MNGGSSENRHLAMARKWVRGIQRISLADEVAALLLGQGWITAR
jgi:hypothetical protein